MYVVIGNGSEQTYSKNVQIQNTYSWFSTLNNFIIIIIFFLIYYVFSSASC